MTSLLHLHLFVYSVTSSAKWNIHKLAVAEGHPIVTDSLIGATLPHYSCIAQQITKSLKYTLLYSVNLIKNLSQMKCMSMGYK